jgi:hypothetical protein
VPDDNVIELPWTSRTVVFQIGAGRYECEIEEPEEWTEDDWRHLILAAYNTCLQYSGSLPSMAEVLRLDADGRGLLDDDDGGA